MVSIIVSKLFLSGVMTALKSVVGDAYGTYRRECLEHTLETAYKWLLEDREYIKTIPNFDHDVFCKNLDKSINDFKSEFGYILDKALSSDSEFGRRIIGVILGEILKNTSKLSFEQRIIIQASSVLTNDEIYVFLVKHGSPEIYNKVTTGVLFNRKHEILDEYITDRFTSLCLVSSSSDYGNDRNFGSSDLTKKNPITKKFIDYAISVLTNFSPESNLPERENNSMKCFFN